MIQLLYDHFLMSYHILDYNRPTTGWIGDSKGGLYFDDFQYAGAGNISKMKLSFRWEFNTWVISSIQTK